VRNGVIPRLWRRVKHQWRVWRSYQRRTHAMFALVALLSLGVFEPLICIIHCQFWMPFVLKSYFATHHHHMMPAGPAPMDDADMAGMAHMLGAASAQVVPLLDSCPLYRGHSSDAPMPAPPSPVHDVTLPLIALALVILLVAVQSTPPLTGPPRVF